MGWAARIYQVFDKLIDLVADFRNRCALPETALSRGSNGME